MDKKKTSINLGNKDQLSLPKSSEPIRKSMQDIIDDRKNSHTTQMLLDQIKILEIEKGELKDENDTLKKKLQELGHVEDNSNVKQGEKSLINRVGGLEKLKKIIDLQYELMLQHDDIGNQFHTMAYYCPDSLIKLKEHQLQFTSILYGDKNAYTGRNIRQVHKFKGITNEDFNIWIECCREAYEKMGVDQETTDEGMTILEQLINQVVI